MLSDRDSRIARASRSWPKRDRGARGRISPHERSLRVEPLEERTLLSVIPGFTEPNAPLSCPADVTFGDSARQADPASGAPGAAEAVVFVDPAVDDYASLLDCLVSERLGEAPRGLQH